MGINTTRRSFLRQTGLLATAGAYVTFGGRIPQLHAAETAAEAVAGKDPRLIVHSAQPAEIETPLSMLREHALTPKEILFVRNNQTLAGSRTLEPIPLEGWKIDWAGLVNRAATLEAKLLSEMEQVDRVVVLQCSGNGRAFFSQAAPAKGAQWTAGAMGNVKFSGVPLAKVLSKLGIEPQPSARFVTAEGRDPANKPGEPDFEHSLPLDEVLEKSILALRMNGEPLPAAHGGPVRLVTPGFYGTMNVKWLSRLRFEAQETANYHQQGRYRTPKRPITPGEAFAYGSANSDPNWQMAIKSVIFAPLEGEKLRAGKTLVKGVAFNDGAARITAVEISTDGGQSWRQSTIKAPDSPYAWYHWQREIELPRGEIKILARAVDRLGRTQPLDGAVRWNPSGYGFSGVQAVKVEAI